MLSKEEKTALEALEKSYWWDVLKKLANDRIDEINRTTIWTDWFDPENKETQSKLKESNLKILAIKEVLNLVKINTLGVSRPKV